MVSDISDVEVYVRALGLPYSRAHGSIVVEHRDRRGEPIGIAIMYDRDTGVLRVAAPLDVEPTREGLRILLEENFTSTTYKYALDYEGFITVVYDLPGEYVDNARKLREAILYVVDGARRVLERTRVEEETESREEEEESS
jgi:hypothetical protein